MNPTPETTAARIHKATPLRPKVGLVLGSGFNSLQDAVKPALSLPYQGLPGFPASRVPGHAGKLIAGRLAGLPLLVLCGRSHYYEGFSFAEISFPIRVLRAAGIDILILTNAAGGINRRYRVGDFMCLTDHINLMGDNPLRGFVAGGNGCFLDLSEAYDRKLIGLLRTTARQKRIRLHCGVYAALPGPCYETPAEIRALAHLGADAVGMSTVPETIVARHCGMRVAALSCITNEAAGLGANRISHTEVLATGQRVARQATTLLTAVARALARSDIA